MPGPYNHQLSMLASQRLTFTSEFSELIVLLATTLGKFGLFIYDMTLRDLIYSYRVSFSGYDAD